MLMNRILYQKRIRACQLNCYVDRALSDTHRRFAVHEVCKEAICVAVHRMFPLPGQEELSKSFASGTGTLILLAFRRRRWLIDIAQQLMAVTCLVIIVDLLTAKA